MSGINSLSGLNKVNVDFRPTVNLEEQNKVNANEPQQVQGAAPENAQSVKEAAKSVVRQLDVLLLGAAKKSVGADTVKNVETVGQSLVRKGVLSETDVTRLKNLAESAAEKLKALDKLRRCQLSRARSRSRNLTAQRLRSGTRSPTSGVIAWSIARRTTSATTSTGCSSNVQS